ncbi:MAG: AI-2E family transporter [Actinomycetota bacterium]
MAVHQQTRPSTATVVRIVVTTVLVLAIIYAIYQVRSVLILALVALFLAVGLDPAVRILERRGLKRGQAVTLIFVASILFIAGFIAAVVPPLISQVAHFASNLPHYVQDLADKNPRIARFVSENDISTKLKDATSHVPSIIGGSLGKVVGVAGSVASAFFNMLTVFVLTIYFLLSLAKIREGSLRLVPRSERERVAKLVDPILEKVGAYVGGNIATSIIAGAVSFIFLISARVPYPVALALWVAIADLIPLVGATLGAIPAVIVAFFASPLQGIATVVFFIIYQQVENYFVVPRVMKKAVDLSPAAVLVAALVGAGLLGFVGALMAIPAAAALKIVVHEVVVPRSESA